MLTSRDVLVIDEAGMVGTRQLERVLSRAAEAGAKVVLVGDPQQLQSIEAGAAFRSIPNVMGGVEITEVRRQREDWQRDATRDLATGRTRRCDRRLCERHGACCRYPRAGARRSDRPLGPRTGIARQPAASSSPTPMTR
jgi:ATP-dependent exoDNAse (exonuclease V) alpha subunit